MNWHGLNEWQQWILGIGASLAAALLIWLGKKLFFEKQDGRTHTQSVRQSASPTITQNFNPTINIHPPSTPPVKTTFQAARQHNLISEEEAQERRLNQWERQLHMLIDEVRLIHTSDKFEYLGQINLAIQDINGFFATNPHLRHLNIELLRPLASRDFYAVAKQTAIDTWIEAEYSREAQQHPCEKLVNEMVEHLLLLRVRPERTMREFEDTLPK